MYTKLKVYDQAILFARDAIAFAGSLPPEHRFGLTQQLQRSAVSVPSNIAEGAGRGDPKDFARFLRISIGSANEADCQLHICALADAGDGKTIRRLRDECASIRRQLYSLERRVKKGELSRRER